MSLQPGTCLGPYEIVARLGEGGMGEVWRALEGYSESYTDVTAAGVHRCRYCMPYENDLGTFIGPKRKAPIEKAWPGCKHFE